MKSIIAREATFENNSDMEVMSGYKCCRCPNSRRLRYVGLTVGLDSCRSW